MSVRKRPRQASALSLIVWPSMERRRGTLPPFRSLPSGIKNSPEEQGCADGTGPRTSITARFSDGLPVENVVARVGPSASRDDDLETALGEAREIVLIEGQQSDVRLVQYAFGDDRIIGASTHDLFRGGPTQESSVRTRAQRDEAPRARETRLDEAEGVGRGES